ncbi:hypothetical protein [Streptomyces sp. NPDC053431]|uniref:hypothetical protein n=1 Tax=Streptomyces sp. NPDC053431 TaxID=3365703 RepID=UPI0037CE0A1F
MRTYDASAVAAGGGHAPPAGPTRAVPPYPGEPGVPVHHLVRRLVRRRLTRCLATVRK